MKILTAFEQSQEVTKAFRAKGHIAFSCDIKPCSGGHPEWHLQEDARDALTLGFWDIIIMHPPCTALSVSGNSTYAYGKPKNNERYNAIRFVADLWINAIHVCDKVCMENPVGVLNTNIPELPKPHYVQPYEFGHDASKNTGLWLYGLPDLKPTEYIEPRIINGKKIWSNQTPSGQNKLGPSPERATLRSKTYSGIANAMANQWG